MNIEKINEIITDTYKKTLEDNLEINIRFYRMILKLCTYLMTKGILTEKDVVKIIDSDVDIDHLFDLESQV